MPLKNLLKTSPTAWVAVGLAVVLVGVGALLFTGWHPVHAARENPVDARIWYGNRWQQLKDVLGDESKDAQQRVEEALNALEDVTGRRATSAWSPDRWMPFTAPLFDNLGDPFLEMDRLRLDMNQLFRDAFSRMRGDPLRSLGMGSEVWAPSGEFIEHEDEYQFRFDLPGVDKTKVNITLENGQMILEGLRESQVEAGDLTQFRREIQHGKFRRTISLPADIDINSPIDSKLEDGVLTITLPKQQSSQQRQSRQIEIN